METNPDPEMIHVMAVLGIHPSQLPALTLKQLKQRYYKQALKIHPDKNTSPTANGAFAQLANAYECMHAHIRLRQTLNEEGGEEEDEEEDEEGGEEGVSSPYTSFISRFIHDRHSAKFGKIIQAVVMCGPELAHIVIGKIVNMNSHKTCIDLYTTLCKYQSILQLRPETIELVRNAVQRKYEHIQVYTLTPTMDDLFAHRIYPLQVNGMDAPLAVPLWNTELYFDGKTPDCEVVVICTPILPDNVTEIDEKNNIYCRVYVPDIRALQTHVSFYLGERLFEIPVCELYIRSRQLYILKNQGISNICESDPCRIGPKSNIIVQIDIQLNPPN